MVWIVAGFGARPWWANLCCGLTFAYAAEHHYRPAVHWTRLPAFHRAIADEQRRAGVHVIEIAHAVGFLAPANRRARLRNPEPAA